jgi:hypothetical protein
MNEYERKVYILRCCRDWPVHMAEGLGMNGRCGACHQIPEYIHKEYRGPNGNSTENAVGSVPA